MSGCMTVQGYRDLRTQSTEITLGSYRDVAKLPPSQNTRFKRAYLKGASNRVKSLKEEKEYAHLWSERRSQDKQKFTVQDQLVRVRNLHLHRLEPIEPQLEMNKLNPNSQIEINTDPHQQLIGLTYHAKPIICKTKKIISLKDQKETPYSQTRTSFTRLEKTKTESMTSTYTLMMANKQRELAKSIQMTSYGSLKLKTQQSKTNTTPQKNSTSNSIDGKKKHTVPVSLEGAKKYLQQYV